MAGLQKNGPLYWACMPFDSRFAAFKLMQEKNKGGGYDQRFPSFCSFSTHKKLALTSCTLHSCNRRHWQLGGRSRHYLNVNVISLSSRFYGCLQVAEPILTNDTLKDRRGILTGFQLNPTRFVRALRALPRDPEGFL